MSEFVNKINQTIDSLNEYRSVQHKIKMIDKDNKNIIGTSQGFESSKPKLSRMYYDIFMNKIELKKISSPSENKKYPTRKPRQKNKN